MQIQFKVKESRHADAPKIDLSFKDMTRGEALALAHALAAHAQESAIADDLRIGLGHAIQRVQPEGEYGRWLLEGLGNPA